MCFLRLYTRAVCNVPEVTGTKFTTNIERAITLFLKNMPEYQRILNLKENRVNVFNILRGGLNFRLRESISKSFLL